MITTKVFLEKYANEALALTKSFYPGEEVKVVVDESAAHYPDKNSWKRDLYDELHAATGKTLPWGAMTGIRPTRLALSNLLLGHDDAFVHNLMSKDYYVSDEKIELSLSVAKREIEVLNKIGVYENAYSLYVGIPFCPSTCLYCSFTSYSIAAHESKVDTYIDTLIWELTQISNKMRGKCLTTIYIGGGTPTSLSPERLKKLLDAIDELFDTKNVYEYSIEAGRPDSITYEKLKEIKSHPITRISINPQTMKDETLKLIGRAHRSSDIIRAFDDARSLGFDNINTDIILGLPEENIDDVKHTLEEIKKLDPENLTVHSLALKHKSRLNLKHEDYERLMIENSQSHMDSALKAGLEMDMTPYYLYRQKNMAANLENVGLSKPGKEGIYNILMMEEMQMILAAGAGVTSKVVKDGQTYRCENVRELTVYIDRIEEMWQRKEKLLEIASQ